MKLKWDHSIAEKALKYLKEYKYVFIVIAVGILLLLWPSGKDGGGKTPEDAGTAEDHAEFSVEALEEKMNLALSQVDGAGKVRVVLTVKRGMERVYAADGRISESDGQRTEERETVVISAGGGDEAVMLTQRYPEFQGALVVCEGGDDPRVKLLITQAVSSLTGLGSDRITVCKGG